MNWATPHTTKGALMWGVGLDGLVKASPGPGLFIFMNLIIPLSIKN